MSSICELCEKEAPPIESGPFAGQPSIFDYCIYCSRDLCPDCFKKECDEHPDEGASHEVATDE